MSYETWEDVVSAAALGDSEATSLLASQMAKIDQGATQDSAQVRALRVEAARLNGQKAFLKTYAGWLRANPDMLTDDELYLKAIERDAALAEAQPEMPEADRLELVAQVVRDEMGDPETRGNQDAIHGMAVSRGKRAGEPESAYERARGRQGDAADNHSATIAAMAKERRGMRVEQLSPEELKAQQRPQRRFAHPPR